jgi:DnaJ-class molecular chaperone
MGIGLRLLGIALTLTAVGMIIRSRAAQRDYAVLDLNPSASPADVQRAYRDLVQVWHPDRFEHDPRLQRKAQAKLQAIRDAYERLRKR